MKTLFYTFRTFPLTHELKSLNPFIFGKLKDDIETFKEKILKEKPDYIVGFAKIKQVSRYESVAVNQFNKGIIDINGSEEFQLHIPQNPIFKISSSPTISFCNWTMYQIISFIQEKNLKTKLIFIHLNEGDFDKISKLKSSLC